MHTRRRSYIRPTSVRSSSSIFREQRSFFHNDILNFFPSQFQDDSVVCYLAKKGESDKLKKPKPEKTKSEKPKAEKVKAEKVKAEKPKAEKPKSEKPKKGKKKTSPVGSPPPEPIELAPEEPRRLSQPRNEGIPVDDEENETGQKQCPCRHNVSVVYVKPRSPSQEVQRASCRPSRMDMAPNCPLPSYVCRDREQSPPIGLWESLKRSFSERPYTRSNSAQPPVCCPCKNNPYSDNRFTSPGPCYDRPVRKQSTNFERPQRRNNSCCCISSARVPDNVCLDRSSRPNNSRCSVLSSGRGLLPQTSTTPDRIGMTPSTVPSEHLSINSLGYRNQCCCARPSPVLCPGAIKRSDYCVCNGENIKPIYCDECMELERILALPEPVYCDCLDFDDPRYEGTLNFQDGLCNECAKEEGLSPLPDLGSEPDPDAMGGPQSLIDVDLDTQKTTPVVTGATEPIKGKKSQKSKSSPGDQGGKRKKPQNPKTPTTASSDEDDRKKRKKSPPQVKAKSKPTKPKKSKPLKDKSAGLKRRGTAGGSIDASNPRGLLKFVQRKSEDLT